MVLGSLHDPHVEWVRNALDARAVTSTCVDIQALSETGGSYDPAERRLIVGDTAIRSCGLIWYRRTHRTRIGRMNLADTAFARAEFRHFLLGALAGFGAEWHSRPELLDAASYKPAQLAWAMADPRLTVPETLVSSSPTHAHAFLGSDPMAFVAKPLSGGTIETACGYDAIPTTRVTPLLAERIEDLRNAPCILQRFVPRTFDVRLTVVGDAIFTARLDTRGDPDAEADSRRVFYTDMGYAVIDPPAGIADACRAMCAQFGITFGAFDFAIDRDDRWHFLELNPYGQWAWVEEMTGMAIAAAFADFFVGRLSATVRRGSPGRIEASSPGARRVAGRA